MKYPTVSALCEGVAGAIREKEGSTALINPQDFVDRIKGLEGGGGIPDVPTLECWKITVTDDNRDSLLDFISNRLENWTDNTTLTTCCLQGEQPNDVIVRAGADLFTGSGWQGYLQEVYVLAYVKAFQGNYENFVSDIEATGASRTTLNEWLTITAQAKGVLE
jgi:hypothetical protein